MDCSGYIPANTHSEEQARLSDLYDLGVLDTPVEKRFDRITKLVSRTLGLNSVLISLVDENRQWFKSTCNFDAHETGRDVAFCAHAINEKKGVLLIPDTHADVKFCNNPLVTSDPLIRAYAGIVLYSKNNLPIGTLCGLHFSPRDFSDEFVKDLKDFAAIVEDELNKPSAFLMGIKEFDKDYEYPESSAMSYSEFCQVAESLVQIDAKHETVFFSISAPKSGKYLRIYGRDFYNDIKREILGRLRDALTGFRFVIGDDDDLLFTGIIACNKDSLELYNTAEVLDMALNAPIQINAVIVNTPVHIGFGNFNSKDETFLTLIAQSQMACSSMKVNQLDSSHAFYQEGLALKVNRQRKVASKFKECLENNTIQLFFQPKISVSDNRVIGVEALIRWFDDELGYVTPLEIIDAATEVDYLEYLDEWVFHTACKHMAKWRQQGTTINFISINICAETITRIDFKDWALGIINSYGLPPEFMDFEILESSIFENIDHIIKIIDTAQQAGFTFSLDDFGTGQSSLSYLLKLPFKYLKIDKTFIDDIVHDQSKSSFVHSIMSMGRTLKKKVVVEGVENHGQYLILRSFGCDYIQGYYFSKPISESDLLALLAKDNGHILPEGIDNL